MCSGRGARAQRASCPGRGVRGRGREATRTLALQSSGPTSPTCPAWGHTQELLPVGGPFLTGPSARSHPVPTRFLFRSRDPRASVRVELGCGDTAPTGRSSHSPISPRGLGAGLPHGPRGIRASVWRHPKAPFPTATSLWGPTASGIYLASVPPVPPVVPPALVSGTGVWPPPTERAHP